MTTPAERNATFIRRLHEIRVLNRLTLTEVARQTFMARSAIGDIEAGSRRITLWEAVDLANVYGVPLATLLDAAPFRYRGMIVR